VYGYDGEGWVYGYDGEGWVYGYDGEGWVYGYDGEAGCKDWPWTPLFTLELVSTLLVVFVAIVVAFSTAVVVVGIILHAASNDVDEESVADVMLPVLSLVFAAAGKVEEILLYRLSLFLDPIFAGTPFIQNFNDASVNVPCFATYLVVKLPPRNWSVIVGSTTLDTIVVVLFAVPVIVVVAFLLSKLLIK
jgi:hypothetical protein